MACFGRPRNFWIEKNQKGPFLVFLSFVWCRPLSVRPLKEVGFLVGVLVPCALCLCLSLVPVPVPFVPAHCSSVPFLVFWSYWPFHRRARSMLSSHPLSFTRFRPLRVNPLKEISSLVGPSSSFSFLSLFRGPCSMSLFRACIPHLLWSYRPFPILGQDELLSYLSYLSFT